MSFIENKKNRWSFLTTQIDHIFIYRLIYWSVLTNETIKLMVVYELVHSESLVAAGTFVLSSHPLCDTVLTIPMSTLS